MLDFATVTKVVNSLRNKEPLPEEIVANGFRPPVQTPDGVYEYGDELTANWLNWLLNDLYKSVVVEDISGTVTPGPTFDSYFAIKCGDVMVQGGAFQCTASTTLLTFPIPFEVGSTPVVFVSDYAASVQAGILLAPMDTQNFADLYKACNIAGQRNGANESPGWMFWVAFGHTVANSGGSSGGRHDDRQLLAFCDNDISYSDGQVNKGAPDTPTQNVGFVPPNVNNGVWQQGDGLSAQVLNFLLHDLYKRPRYSNIGGAHQRAGAIRFGGISVVWQQVSQAANTATVTWNYNGIVFDNTPEVIACDVMAFNGTIPANYVCNVLVNNSATTTSCTLYGCASPATAIAMGGVFVIAIGKTGALAENQGLSGFAVTDITYPDGQLNKVAPSAAQISDGFKFETPTAEGDYFTANKFNWLLNDLYKQAGYEVRREQVNMGSTTQWVYKLRLGPLLIQAGAFTGADVSAGGGRLKFPYPFKSRPQLMATHRPTAAPPTAIGGALPVARYITPDNPQPADVGIVERVMSGAVGAASNERYSFFAVGLAP